MIRIAAIFQLRFLHSFSTKAKSGFLSLFLCVLIFFSLFSLHFSWEKGRNAQKTLYIARLLPFQTGLEAILVAISLALCNFKSPGCPAISNCCAYGLGIDHWRQNSYIPLFGLGNCIRQLLQETLLHRIPGRFHQSNVTIGAVLP